MKRIFYLILVNVLFLSAMPFGMAFADKSQINLRVCVLDDATNINLALKGAYKIYEINSDRVLMEGPSLRATLSGAKSGLAIGKKEITVYGIKVKTTRDANIYINGERLRGDVDIIRKDNLKLMVINNIGLEEYLYGVLYHEISHRWPIEVIKAQAIAARTYALYQKKQNKAQPYDLRSDIYSQVYGGRASEKWATTKAVNLTKEMVIVFNAALLPSYYHATCAGYTEDASNLWNVDLSPLKGVECNYCKKSPHYKWTKEIPLTTLESKLKENGYNVGEVESVNVLSKNRSGRIDKLEIKDKSGVSVILIGKDFRQMFGPNEVRSTKFDIVIKRGQLILNGVGWGHGVGMCQWGAYGMAKKGKKKEEILQYYYPGIEITTIDKLKDAI